MNKSNKICLTDDFGNDIDIDELVVLYEQDGRPQKEIEDLYARYTNRIKTSEELG